MFDHPAVAKAFVTAACALAIALLTIGMGVNSTRAGSDQPSGLNFTPISSGGVFPPVPSARHPRCTSSHYRQCLRLAAVSQDCAEYETRQSALDNNLVICAAGFGVVGTALAVLEIATGCEAGLPNTGKATCLAIAKCVFDYETASNSLQAQYDPTCYQ